MNTKTRKIIATETLILFISVSVLISLAGIAVLFKKDTQDIATGYMLLAYPVRISFYAIRWAVNVFRP